MIIDGEKYACEACVRGHRVSNCQHSNRPLQHINKKGRPVSQCAHCRSMRKSRSAHIKCDCGEKTSKCIHLQPPAEGHLETCCCNHGGRCTCAGKKEVALDTVPESDSEGELQKASTLPPRPVPRRRRANTIHSSDIGGLTFDQHGHHKPAKHNRASQKCGPYQLNRVNSAASAGSLGTSTDNLLYQAHGEGHAAVQHSFLAREQRQVKSEAASPLMSASSFTHLNSNLPPLDLSNISNYSYVSNTSFDLFSNGLSDADAPILSASLAQSVDWSHYDLREANGDTFTPSSYSQAGTQFTGHLDFGSGSEHLPNLAGTTSTSGDVSEVEDFMPGGEGDFDGFAAGGSFLRQANVDLTSIDYSLFDKADNQALTGDFSTVEDDPAFYIPNYSGNVATVDESPDPLGAGSLGGYWEM
ncbi:copper fist dna-binding domain-containing [Trichoderma arundinaceum]|uniref:Copper fist dna-binding domain-containing n=1 Tax=Trichoderma arundinaceum TaxID=490622 RepID=A0A395N8H6_TRIAR|nr:copper fist dna-binding domain-containing [Trichoderma arundinaceum]